MARKFRRAARGMLLPLHLRYDEPHETFLARALPPRLHMPFRPVMPRGGGMCLEQAADLEAAQQGRITWAQYFRKWGPSL